MGNRASGFRALLRLWWNSGRFSLIQLALRIGAIYRFKSTFFPILMIALFAFDC